jgi:ATP-dependent Clp protease adaptor protein ClpS
MNSTENHMTNHPREDRYDVVDMRRKLLSQHFFVRLHPIKMSKQSASDKLKKAIADLTKATSKDINKYIQQNFSAVCDRLMQQITSHTIYETQDAVKINPVIEQVHNLIVWNDEVNTFDWVISSLMEVCDHSAEQAEQCALIIHQSGKYSVRKGSFDTLRPMCEALIDRNIQATIDY